MKKLNRSGVDLPLCSASGFPSFGVGLMLLERFAVPGFPISFVNPESPVIAIELSNIFALGG